jgi:hypothetical protein
MAGEVSTALKSPITTEGSVSVRARTRAATARA